MPVLTVEYFNKIKDYVHPNSQTIIKDYQNGNVITLPPFMAATIEMKMELGN